MEADSDDEDEGDSSQQPPPPEPAPALGHTAGTSELGSDLGLSRLQTQTQASTTPRLQGHVKTRLRESHRRGEVGEGKAPRITVVTEI